MNVLDRILELRLERGWSEYRLSEESGISQTTISSWFRKQICPTIPSLEKICDAYNITLAQFFDDSCSCVSLTKKQSAVLQHFNALSKEKQDALLNYLSTK
ncbi:MAG: helix-turn-helix transcriptional regulator [Clostridia bacterium]|nr:helix-turn-helix transcriptional regulator [Clostridia bacterium]